MSAVKRTPADIAFSDAVRESFDYTCCLCGMDGRERPGMMDCSHVFSRKHRNTRWTVLVALCLCRSCHQKMGDRPLLHAALYRDVWGEEAYEQILRDHNRILKISKVEEKLIAKHYRAEAKRAEKLRNAGYIGRIDIQDWRD